jgi:hypothetical protein
VKSLELQMSALLEETNARAASAIIESARQQRWSANIPTHARDKENLEDLWPGGLLRAASRVQRQGIHPLDGSGEKVL